MCVYVYAYVFFRQESTRIVKGKTCPDGNLNTISFVVLVPANGPSGPLARQASGLSAWVDI